MTRDRFDGEPGTLYNPRPLRHDDDQWIVIPPKPTKPKRQTWRQRIQATKQAKGPTK